MGSNPDSRGVKPATNRRSYGTAITLLCCVEWHVDTCLYKVFRLPGCSTELCGGKLPNVMGEIFSVYILFWGLRSQILQKVWCLSTELCSVTSSKPLTLILTAPENWDCDNKSRINRKFFRLSEGKDKVREYEYRICRKRLCRTEITGIYINYFNLEWLPCKSTVSLCGCCNANDTDLYVCSLTQILQLYKTRRSLSEEMKHIEVIIKEYALYLLWPPRIIGIINRFV
jgi:hypothetical protein